MAQARFEPRVVPPSGRAHERYINRELSRLTFEERVLAMAEDQSLPLLERVRFLAIFSQNLDDFFQVRVAGLMEKVVASVSAHAPDGMTTPHQLRAIREKVKELIARQDRTFEDDLRPRLTEAGIQIVNHEQLGRADREFLSRYFRENIFPVLTPRAVDPAHPFPYISHLSLNLAVTVRDPLRKHERFARVKVPPLLPRFLALPDGQRMIPVEQVISMHLQSLFPGMEVVAQHLFRVTRDADLDLDDGDADDLLAAVKSELRRKSRKALVVRLEIDRAMPDEVQHLLLREMDLESSGVYRIDTLLDLRALWSLYYLDRPELKAEPWTPTTQLRLRGQNGGEADIFSVLQQGDVLVHHPYDSFATSVEAFIEQASRDPDVLAIKQTLYRTAGPATSIANALANAAETGKQVVVLVELKARGDEQANIASAQALEDAGVHVVYGVVGLKTHAKVTLVVRREGSGIRHYLHVGTGNYNPSTANHYEDIGMLSADQELGADLAEFFNFLTGYSRQRKYRKLLVAPTTLRTAIVRLIRGEAHEGGRIIIKVNNLVDIDIIDALYDASRRGAVIDLVVRSSCSLRPGIPGLSESIRVRSIVGRYLEHSRVFCFGREDAEPRIYIGSADLMSRNLDRRVEAITPVTDPALRDRVLGILRVNLHDDTLAWELGPDGSWTKAPPNRGVNTHRRLQEMATARSHGTSEGDA
ncbi:MAG: polyphosphate kinase 1 [Candidatus Dormibacteria bacterium]